jgi:hypothetical protein
MAVVFFCFSFVFAQGTKFKTIGADEVKAMLESGERVLIIDARSEEEYKAGHLPKAINVSPRLFPFGSTGRARKHPDTSRRFPGVGPEGLSSRKVGREQPEKAGKEPS